LALGELDWQIDPVKSRSRHLDGILQTEDLRDPPPALPILPINALYKADCRDRRPFRRHFPSDRLSARRRPLAPLQNTTIHGSDDMLLSNRAGTSVHASTRRSTLCGAVVLHRPQRCRSRSYLCDSRAYHLFLRSPDAVGSRSVRSQLRSSISLFKHCFGAARASSGLEALHSQLQAKRKG